MTLLVPSAVVIRLGTLHVVGIRITCRRDDQVEMNRAVAQGQYLDDAAHCVRKLLRARDPDRDRDQDERLVRMREELACVNR